MTQVSSIPVYDMYWTAEARYAKIADVMSKTMKCYKQLRKYIHIVGNTTKKKSWKQKR